MIAARDLALAAGERALLRDLSFDLERGEFVAVLGPNGAGKTTLLRTLAGVRPALSGSVLIDGREIATLSAAERARYIAHIAADELFIEHLIVRDVVCSGRYAHHQWWQWRETPSDHAAVGRALQAVQMDAFTQRQFSTLSSGERQRVWLAMALAQEAPVLLLDEPTSHLDVRAAQEILMLLHAQVRGGKTVVCVLHDINEAAQFADRIMLIAGGTMLALDVAPAVLRSPLLSEAYGTAMEVTAAPSGGLRVFPTARHHSSEASGMPLP